MECLRVCSKQYVDFVSLPAVTNGNKSHDKWNAAKLMKFNQNSFVHASNKCCKDKFGK